ncbi:MAG: sodium-independent anion transporter, partial [Desulfobaccales bacterium]
DYTAAATLRSLYERLREQGIRLIFYAVSDGVYAQLKRSGITLLIGQDAFYATLGAVIRAYEAIPRTS